MKHRTNWEDDGQVGIDCYVVTKEATRIQSGERFQRPTYGGSVSVGEVGVCEQCGQRLSVKWDVRLIEVAEKGEAPDHA